MNNVKFWNDGKLVIVRVTQTHAAIVDRAGSRRTLAETERRMLRDGYTRRKPK